MARCGCSSDCPCAVQSGNCIRVVGSGAPSSPYVVSIILDPDVDNILECTDDGLTAALPIPAVDVESTDCIDMDGDGLPTNPIRATPRIDNVVTNGLSCSASGLKASALGKPLFRPVQVTVNAPLNYGDLALVDSSGADVTVTLPPVGAMTGASVVVKKMVAGNSVIVQGYAGQQIQAAPTATLTGQWSSVTLVSTGTIWIKIAEI